MALIYCLLWVISTATAVQYFSPETSQVINEEMSTNFTTTILVITGEETLLPYEEFRGIPDQMKSTLVVLDLRYLQIDCKFLIASLEGCDQLESLLLYYVELIGQFSTKVSLPSLTRFSMEVYDIDAETPEDFFKYMFFQNSPKEEIEMVPTNVNVYLNIKTGMKELRYSADISQLIIYYFPYDVSKYFNYTEISYVNSAYDLKTLKYGQILSLWITSSALISEAEMLYLQKSVNLQTLVLDIKRKTKELSKMSFNASHFKNLIRLELQNSRVRATDISELKQLQMLKLKHCEFIWNSDVNSLMELSALALINVKFINGSLDQLINKYFNLTDLTLSTGGSYSRSSSRESQFDLKMLENSTQSLLNLDLNGFQLFISAPIYFPFLTSLTLDRCFFWEPAVPISHVFKNVEQLYVRDTSPVVFNELLNNTSVQEVSINAYDINRSPKLHTFLLQSSVRLFENRIDLIRSNQTLTGWIQRCAGEEATNLQNPALRDALLRIYVLTLSLCCLIGILGNGLSALVLTRKTMRSSTSFILLGLTLTDSIILLSYAGSLLYFGIKFVVLFLNLSIPEGAYYVFFFQVTKESLQNLDNIHYFLIYPLNKTAYTGSIYFTVLLTVERYLAVCWPLRVKRFLGIRKSIYASIAVIIFSILFNFPRWIEAKQSDTIIYYQTYVFEACSDVSRHLVLDRVASGSGLLRYRYYRRYYHGVIWVTLMYVVPIATLVGLNLRIWKQLRIATSNRSTIVQSNRDRDDEEFNRLTKMLLCVTTIFVICNCLGGIVILILVGSGASDPADVEVISCIPLIINSSVNFMVYCLMGQKFRNELIRILPHWLTKRLKCTGKSSPTTRNETRSVNTTTSFKGHSETSL